jgi:hypothetical protein
MMRGEKWTFARVSEDLGGMFAVFEALYKNQRMAVDKENSVTSLPSSNQANGSLNAIALTPSALGAKKEIVKQEVRQESRKEAKPVKEKKKDRPRLSLTGFKPLNTFDDGRKQTPVKRKIIISVSISPIIFF